MVVGFFFRCCENPKKKNRKTKKNTHFHNHFMQNRYGENKKEKRNDKKLDLNLSCLFIYLCYFSLLLLCVCACGVVYPHVYFAYRLFDEPNSIWENIWRAIKKTVSDRNWNNKKSDTTMWYWAWIDGLQFASLLFLCACVRFDCKWVKMIDDDKIIEKKKTTELWVVHKITLIFFTVTLGISQWITHTLTVGRSVGSRKTSIFGMRVCGVNGQSLIKMRRVFNRFQLTHTDLQHELMAFFFQKLLHLVSRCFFFLLLFFYLLLRRIHSGIFTLHLRRLLSN